MKLKAVITALILGSSSIAMAGPATTVFSADASWRAGYSSSRPVLRDHRYRNADERYYQHRDDRPVFDDREHGYGWRDRRNSWVSLGSVTQIVEGGDMEFEAGRYGGRFSQLMLHNVAGKSRIFRVTIEYANGHLQVVDLDRYLIRGNPDIRIDLEGRSRVSRVIVNGRNARNSTFSVLAL